MDIKGFKIDFMDRDDQYMVDFNRRCAEAGAKYRLLIDLHGTYKPTGLQRTYPNADRVGKDYQRKVMRIPADRKLRLHMAPGGGFALKIRACR